MLQLRDYQREALEAWIQKGAYGTVVMPTGTGKTFLALEAIRRELERGGAAAVIVPTIALAQQWRDRVQRYLGVRPALFYGDEKDISRVTIFVINSAHRYQHLLAPFTLVVVDEVHHLSAPTWSQLIPALDGKRVLGLTATPEGQPLPIAYYMSIPRARLAEAVVPVRIIPVFVPLTPEEWAEYQDIEQQIRRVAAALESARLRRDPGARDLETRLQVLANRRRQLVSLASAKFLELPRIAARHPGEKILVFTESIESAELARRALVRAGVSAQCYHSLLPPSTRRVLLQEWGRSFRVLVAVRCLDEGIDVPECGVGVVIASGKSTRQLIQRLGRVIRPHPGKGKQHATMYVVIARGTYEHEVLSKLVRLAYSY
jgi:superfamily II DNA or RNA helicase